ncbi:MAG: tRNA lysidine(34) synthetase TilS [Rikenellaceae bacterium]
MLQQFKEAINLMSRRGKILAAVSGGVDSMVMASLFYECKCDFSIANVNFKLRGEEADIDQQLVIDWAEERGIKLFTTAFATEEYASKYGISIEMAARELRYNWFYKLMDEEGFDFLAVAHNLNDSVETFFLNILRGTGIKGLGGIRQERDNVIRPMIEFTRDEIISYAKSHNVPYREDSTNNDVNFARNRIRNNVFPQFSLINPSFLRTIERDMKYFREAAEIVNEQFQLIISQVLDRQEGVFPHKIRIDNLLLAGHSEYWLYMILGDYGFNSSQSIEINKSLKRESGKKFYSKEYIAVKDRDYLLIYPFSSESESQTLLNSIKIEKPYGDRVPISILGQTFFLRIYPKEKDFMPITSKKILFMDASKIKFPLECRVWSDGDRFMPLGMKNFKKLSDFFIDEKLDIKIKEHQLVLSDDNKNIICVLNHRIDDRYKITSSTSEILEVSIS